MPTAPIHSQRQRGRWPASRECRLHFGQRFWKANFTAPNFCEFLLRVSPSFPKACHRAWKWLEMSGIAAGGSPHVRFESLKDTFLSWTEIPNENKEKMCALQILDRSSARPWALRARTHQRSCTYMGRRQRQQRRKVMGLIVVSFYEDRVNLRARMLVRKDRGIRWCSSCSVLATLNMIYLNHPALVPGYCRHLIGVSLSRSAAVRLMNSERLHADCQRWLQVECWNLLEACLRKLNVS